MLRPSVAKHPQLARRVLDAGHELGNHGDWHLPPPLVPRWWLARDLAAGEHAIVAATRVTPRHYRPAFGVMRPAQANWIRALGYEPVLGDVYPEDPRRPGIDVIAERVIARLRAGSILILHDGCAWVAMDRSQTVAALERILTWAEAQGLRGVSVAELRAAASPVGAAR
jgi:peptidoglycan/xylan/chitin deacetylase (PgdA/CDA1 family)